ncbi:GrpB family protein [Halococcus qingdaonensis]|uniref:GrpB family protein n=1 Tax=Halococcus qingdaonensis TaxID=224402 RepID=UPI002117164F|nr:GrpB family protein [Halococcus qingdaonensis]
MIGLERGNVTLVSHQPKWKREYETKVDRLESSTGDRLHGYEHVGSTAIEGIAAKPVIDLLAVLDDLSAARESLVPLLEEHGYEHRPGDVQGRLFLAKGPRSNRTHYLSLTERDSDFYAETLAFRDSLCENADIAAEYESLKRELAEKHPDDRETYTERKNPFVERVLEDAMNDRGGAD